MPWHNMAWLDRQDIREVLFHPAVVLSTAAVATLLFVLLFSRDPRFAGPGRLILLYYHAPIGFAFTVYAFDRLARWAAIAWRQWLVEVPLIALALSRTVAPLPFFSGHALFLSYVVATPGFRLARGIAALVLVEVIVVKTFLLHDATLIGGTVIGLLAAIIVRRLSAPKPAA
jgi:hypothetical protein